jgi:hypothetical protein
LSSAPIGSEHRASMSRTSSTPRHKVPNFSGITVVVMCSLRTTSWWRQARGVTHCSCSAALHPVADDSYARAGTGLTTQAARSPAIRSIVVPSSMASQDGSSAGCATMPYR